MSWSDDVPAILVRNSAPERDHREPAPLWLKALGLAGLVVSAGVAVALGVMAAWLVAVS